MNARQQYIEKTFLITWKEDHWPYEKLLDLIQRFESSGKATEPWRFMSHKQCKIGDRIYLLKQGDQPRGLFGSGRIVSAPYVNKAAINEAGNNPWCVDVEFDLLVDPKSELVVSETILKDAYSENGLWNTQASGVAIPDDISTIIAAAWISESLKTSKTREWDVSEVRAIVADYFDMLAAESRGDKYNKSQHNVALQKSLKARSHGSVEFKHQNISAILCELKLPYIEGYKPRGNYQELLRKEVDRYLDTHGEMIELVMDEYGVVPDAASPVTEFNSYLESPPECDEERPHKTQNTFIPRKSRFKDMARRDLANKALGSAGEGFIYELEQQRLRSAKRHDLASRVRWVARDDGDGAGYDILSFEIEGKERYIEVKTTNGGARTSFLMTNAYFTHVSR